MVAAAAIASWALRFGVGLRQSAGLFSWIQDKKARCDPLLTQKSWSTGFTGSSSALWKWPFGGPPFLQQLILGMSCDFQCSAPAGASKYHQLQLRHLAAASPAWCRAAYFMIINYTVDCGVMWLGEFCCPCRYNLTQVEKKQERIVQVTSLMIVDWRWSLPRPGSRGKLLEPPAVARCCLDVAGKLLSSCWTLFLWCIWNRTLPATQLLVCKKLQETARNCKKLKHLKGI